MERKKVCLIIVVVVLFKFIEVFVYEREDIIKVVYLWGYKLILLVV